MAYLDATRWRHGDDPAISALVSAMPGLSIGERDALRHLRIVHRFIGRGRSVLRDQEPVSQVGILCKGWAIRSRRLGAHRRQILDLHLPGDLVGLHTDGLGVSMCDVAALTPCEIGEIDVRSLDRIACHNPGVAAGLAALVSRQLAQANDQVMRLGRMTAYERVCHFLLDIHARQKCSLSAGGAVDFPVTQTVAADLLGLSVVHVNRQVMRLRREGLVTLTRRTLVIHDAARMAQVCDFRDRAPATGLPLHLAAE